MNMIIAIAIIAIISIDNVYSGVIREEDSFFLGNERISKRSVDQQKESSPENIEIIELPRVIYTRSIRTDSYRQHDDLLSIVPKAIFGERILKKFVEESAFRHPESHLVFKPQFRFSESIVERIPLQ
ncbi:hypothetical protein QE152_g12783 [Popillia japonica]|uniref:Uncharacterized protein n=1 Tax=Popillia japonica TaxID=7064 RepID=A0AAW1LLP8_POPJA